MAGGDARQVVLSAARTTNGNSSILPLSDKGELLHVLFSVTAASGTSPTLTPSLQWSPDGAILVPADPADAMTALTTTPGAVKTFNVRASSFQINWTIGGTTPSFTFAVWVYVTGAP